VIAATRDGVVIDIRAANAELIDVVARALKVPRRAVTIVAGERSRAKRVAVAGVTREAAEAALQSDR
jgi:uncharacterized protein